MPKLLGNGAPIEVVRGKLAGKVGVVELAATELPGFWWVRLYDERGELGMGVLLQEGQLRRKEPPA